MSLETSYKVGEFIGRIAHHLLKKRRDQVIRNITYAFGDEKTAQEIYNLSREVFERCGANLLCSLRTPFLNDEEILKHLSFEGLDDLLIEAEKGGIVLVSPHMGNWEILAQAVFLTKEKMAVGTHYRPLNNSLINEIVEHRRTRRGLQLFPKHASTHRLISFVRDGGGMGILADQRVGSRGIAGTFFGRPTTLSPLPHLIAKRAKAQLMRLICETTSPCQWKVSFTPITEISAQACANSLEEAWRHSPADVFWFEDRWRIQGKDPLKFLDKYTEHSGVTRPLRLVNLVGGAGALPHPASIITQENATLDFSLDDATLTQALDEIKQRGPVAPDVYICPPEHSARLKKLSLKTQILSVSAAP